VETRIAGFDSPDARHHAAVEGGAQCPGDLRRAIAVGPPKKGDGSNTVPFFAPSALSRLPALVVAGRVPDAVARDGDDAGSRHLADPVGAAQVDEGFDLVFRPGDLGGVWGQSALSR